VEGHLEGLRGVAPLEDAGEGAGGVGDAAGVVQDPEGDQRRLLRGEGDGLLLVLVGGGVDAVARGGVVAGVDRLRAVVERAVGVEGADRIPLGRDRGAGGRVVQGERRVARRAWSRSAAEQTAYFDQTGALAAGSPKRGLVAI
jgi:hypothetical protein